MPRSALLNVMVGAASKAGRRLARDFGEVENLQVSLKGPGDFVSKADRMAEQTLRDELLHARPDYGFLGEESEEIPSRDGRHRWIVDPLDGTTNFLHSIPIFAISIALERRTAGKAEIVAALVYNPVSDELYTAEKGSGAFLNDRRVRVAARRRLEDAVVGNGMPHLGRGEHGRFLMQLRAVMARVAGSRRMGSAALDLAAVAAGRLDAYWEEHLSAWDIAAGLLLVREAGGFVSSPDGGDPLQTGHVIAGNERLHKQLTSVLEEATGQAAPRSRAAAAKAKAEAAAGAQAAAGTGAETAEAG